MFSAYIFSIGLHFPNLELVRLLSSRNGHTSPLAAVAKRYSSFATAEQAVKIAYRRHLCGLEAARWASGKAPDPVERDQ